MSEIKKVMPSQQLSLKYDKLINDLYDTKNVYDTKIVTNEKLIQENINAYYKQEMQNTSLKIILLAFFVILIIVLLYRLRLFDSIYILSIMIVSIILLAMLFIYYLYYMYDYNSYLNRASRNTANNILKNNNQEPIGNELNCDFLQEEESNIMIGNISSSNGTNASLLQNNYNKLLQNTNSNYDIWLKGDHISKQKINENKYKDIDLDIPDYRVTKDGITDVIGKIGPINPKDATYYECEYIGANHNGMPLEKKYMNSTIPCKYYIDYKENGKYIKDNNNNFIKI